MQKPLLLSTTPIASVPARWAIAIGALLALYYRLPLPFFLLFLYLSYLLFSYCWTMISCRSTVGKSSPLQEGVFVGENFSWEFKFYNPGFLPLVRCGLELILPRQFAISSNILLSSKLLLRQEGLAHSFTELYPVWVKSTVFYSWLPQEKELQLVLELHAQLRGVYYFPPADFFVGDPSGLFRGMKQLNQEEYLYVYPHLTSTGDIMKIIALEEKSLEDSFGLEDPYQVQGVRDYQPSDSPKSINWYATARGGNLKANIYQRINCQFCLIVLDLSVINQPHYGHDGTRLTDPHFEQAISKAAGIALYYLEQGAKTAFYTNAPLLQWENQGDYSLGILNAHQKKVRKISTLDFATGESQGQEILKLCAAMDETSRAYAEEQENLWQEVQQVPANTSIYLLGYHNPPDSWNKLPDYDVNKARYQAEEFYSLEKLSSLSSSKVRLLNLS